jgi:uncharacterized protein with FMN-binding domain
LAYAAPKSQTPSLNTGSANAIPTTTTASASAPSGLKDGTFTGKVADAYYGNIQVQAIVSGGKLTDVKFLQYPNDRPASVRISNNAMPLLKSEAITAQNAKVDIVSGATETSQAFQQSLSDALSQASS